MDKSLIQSPYLAACRNQPSLRVPVWLMRQAGRYMQSYRQLRADYDFLTLVKTPELACQITLQPVQEFTPDAAIIFADILPLLDAMGLGLYFSKEDGPVIRHLIDNEDDIARLRTVCPEADLHYTLQAIALTKHELESKRIPLIGFSGAPFTLAYYAIEGGAHKNFIKTFSLMHCRPQLFHILMDKISDAVISYAKAQIATGVDAFQLFDSWAGMLSPHEFEQHVLPHINKVMTALRAYNIPITYFSTQTSSMFCMLNRIPCDVLGVDWRITIADAWRQKNPTCALQGNLSPYALLGTESSVRTQIKHLLEKLREISPTLTGFIFNLGHGIHKETPLENVHALFDEVRAFSCAP